MKKILAFLFVFTYVFNFPQQAGNWKIYTSMRNINDFVISNNAIWGASTGGAFQFNQTTVHIRSLQKLRE